jgi:hypothetical protein
MRITFKIGVLIGLAGFLTTPLPRAAATPTLEARTKVPPQALNVWVNTGSGVYHCSGTRYYGNTKAGKYLSETQARANGYRPAYGRTCGPVSRDSGSNDPQRLILPLSTVRVWVNTGSAVYHCSGTRYYGNTKRGQYMSESEARSQGNRPAYGRRCG